MPDMKFSSYFYGDEAMQFTYFRIPCQLITHPRFKHLSTDSNDSLFAVLKKCHRFRCTDKDSLYASAKDLARVTADSIDGTQLQKLVPSSSGEHWGSLKSLEKYLGTIIPEGYAKRVMGSLFAIYDLRLADAHLPKSDYGRQFQLLGIHEENPFVWQGYEMLHSCVSTICRIAEIFKKIE